MNVQPYLDFDGRCEEALNFYREALGATDVQLMRIQDSPDPTMANLGPPDKILHAEFRIGDAVLMASDGRCGGRPTFQGFSLTMTVADVATVERLFAALSQGGQAQMPLAKTFFAERFGMVTDRFGVSWGLLVRL